ncbi:OmpA family protein [Salisaeta longa]|uniref:OmpA family protein n=1 Tax=Salisaeta longa TaxID=503170 RepID=UPI0003B3CCAB|nr:OmpA family protein [Salisaeta longa]
METLRVRRFSVTALLALGLLLSGCKSLSNTEKGAIIGSGGGAAAGAAIGKATGDNAAEGAIIGAIVGGAAGAIIGNRMDRKAEELDQKLADAKVERVGEGIKVTFDSGILFDLNSAALRPEARENLRKLQQSLSDFPETELLVVGHTDATGPASYNQTLSERRAQSAAEYLMSLGIDPGRINTMGKGESQPVATNETAAGRQQNRRVEIAIYASEEYREEVKQRVSN